MPEYTPDQFADILMGVVVKTPRETVQVVRKGAQNVKTSARRNVRMTAPVQNAHAYRDISYDIDAEGVMVVAEIGYEKGPGKAGNLGGLLEFGGGGDHSPPHRDLALALEAEERAFGEALEDMGEEILD